MKWIIPKDVFQRKSFAPKKDDWRLKSPSSVFTQVQNREINVSETSSLTDVFERKFFLNRRGRQGSDTSSTYVLKRKKFRKTKQADVLERKRQRVET